jgi:hypothetical protein
LLPWLSLSSSHAQSPKEINGSGGAKEKLIGAWQLTHIDPPGPDGKPTPISQPKGMLIHTGDGHMSVQLMYPESANTLSNEYVLNGYEASFGSTKSMRSRFAHGCSAAGSIT